MLLAPLVLSVLAAPSTPIQDTKVEKTVSLAHAAPKDSLFFVQATRLDALRADWLASTWFGFYQDDELKVLRETVEKLVDIAESNSEDEAGESLESELGIDPWKVLESVHGSIAIFGVPQPGQEDPAVGFLFEPGEDRGKFEELFADIKEKEGKSQVASTAEYAGVELSLFEEKEAEASDEGEEEEDADTDFTHSVFFDAGEWAGMLAANTREDLLGIVHGMIDRMSGKDAANGFEDSEALASARATVSAPGRIEVFVDLAKVLAMVKESDPPTEENEDTLEALGVDDLRWIYATADIGKGEKLGAELSIRLPDSGYLREWFGFFSPYPREMAAFAPRASTSISLAQFDVWGMWQSVWKMMEELQPETTEQARDQMTASLQQMGGFDIEKSFVSQLDGRFLSFNVPVPKEEMQAAMEATMLGELEDGTKPGEVSSPTGNAMVIGLRDGNVVSSFVQGILTAVGIQQQVETEEFQGTTIHKLATGGSGGFEWAFTKKNTAVFSQYPTALRAALRMEGAEAKDSALEVEGFKPLYATHANAAILNLANTADSLKSGLNVLQMMGPFIGMGMMRGYAEAGGEGQLPNPFDHLPTAAAIERHFKGTLVTAVTRSSGVLHVGVSTQ